MADEWYVKVGSGVKGPFDATKLRALVLRGLITPEIEVRKGSSRWVPAGRVRGLFDRPKEADTPGETAQGQASLWSGWSGFTEESPSGPDEPPVIDPFRALGLQGVAEAGVADTSSRGTGPPDPLIVVEADEESGPEPEPEPVPEPAPVPASEAPPDWVARIAEGPPDPEADATPLNLQIETHESIRDDVGLPTSREASVASGKPGAADAAEPSSRRRRAYLEYEGVVRSVGLLLHFNGLVGLVASALWAKQVLDRLPNLAGRGSDLRPYYTTILTEGMALLTLAGACFCLGAGVRALQSWARWATATLMAEMVLLGFTVEMICLIQADPRLLPRAASVLLVGMAIPGYVLLVMIRGEGEVVFSEAYREVVRRTPGIRAPWGLLVLALLVIEAVVVAMALVAAWKTIVAA